MKNYLIFLDLPYKKKLKSPIGFLIDKIDVVSFFIFFGRFHSTKKSYPTKLSFLEELTQSRSLLLEPNIEYQSIKLTAKLHRTGNKFFFQILKLPKNCMIYIDKKSFPLTGSQTC